MINYFPLTERLMSNPDFQALTLAEKVYYVFIISEFSSRGEFFRADLEVAVTLGLSEDKVRRARRKLQGLGWLRVDPGTRDRRGACLATTYLDVKHYRPSEGEYFSQVHRHGFEVMLSLVRRGTLKHADVVLYCYLCYWRWRYRGKYDDGRFFVYKSDLREMTRLSGAIGSVERLHALKFDCRMFEYADSGARLWFHDWTDFIDPSECESNQGDRESWREDIAAGVAQAKAGKEAKAKAKAAAQQSNVRRRGFLPTHHR